MIISSDNINENYKLKMISQNRINALLDVCTTNFDHQIYVKYNITGKQDLNYLFYKNLISKEIIISIFNNLIKAIKNIHRYLLSENDILLENDKIYLDVETMNIYFCYYPFNSQDFCDSFKEFIRKLLENIDHSSKEVTEIVYSLYEISSKKNLSIIDIENYLEKENNINVKSTVNINYEIKNDNDFIHNNSFEQNYNILNNDKNKSGIFKSKLKIFKENILSRKGNQEYYDNKEINYCNIEHNSENEKNILCYGETTVLKRPEEYQCCLKEENGDRVIYLENNSMIIGKLKNKVDFELNEPLISRIHAQIFEKSGRYFIQDLNSSNGTFINGKIIEPNEYFEIKIGDRIGFAELVFIFINV